MDPNAYNAEMYGSSLAVGPQADFPTITAARRWAESFGTTADGCTITTRRGTIVARHVRGTSGDGSHWRRVAVR